MVVLKQSKNLSNEKDKKLLSRRKYIPIMKPLQFLFSFYLPFYLGIQALHYIFFAYKISKIKYIFE